MGRRSSVRSPARINAIVHKLNEVASRFFVKRLFVRESLADAEDAGCVVSHRYHVLRGRLGIALTEYLFALLLTKHGDFLLNENSRGAAGRNRPLNIDSLLKETAPIPNMQTQLKVAEAIHWSNKLFSKIAEHVQLLKERRAALISAAVTGKIDVREMA